jgi:hypothetical protein
MNKNSSINEELDSLYTKLETTLLKEQPNPIIALAAVEILKDDILGFLRKKGKTSDISPNSWYTD